MKDEKAGKTLITTNKEKVLPLITKDLDFIAIGELHNSRSAIQFIMDNIDLLIPTGDGRKTYFLTEFLPDDMVLTPSNKNKQLYFSAKNELKDMKKKLIENFSQRESDRIEKSDSYTLDELYKKLFPRVAGIYSIEDQKPSLMEKRDSKGKLILVEFTAEELHKKIKENDLDAFAHRVNKINELACDKAVKIRKKDPTARILIFAGMDHTASIRVLKYDESLKELESKNMKGIAVLLQEKGFKGIDITIHDLALCANKEVFEKGDIKQFGFTKYEKDEVCLTVNTPDILFFMGPSGASIEKIKKGYESIFLPGIHNIAEMKEAAQPKKTKAERKKEKRRARKKETKIAPQSAEAPTSLPPVLPKVSDETAASASAKPVDDSLKPEPIPTVRGESTAQTQKLSGTAAALATFGINAIKEDKEETPGTKPADSP